MAFSLGIRHYRHLNKVLISRCALKHNHDQLKAFHSEAEIAPVLKSNAYGHGLKVVAPVFDSFLPPFLVVDSLYEAYELLSLMLKTPILILGYTYPRNFLIKCLPFHFTVFDLESAKVLNESQRNCKVHIFVDTGMNREGVPLSELSLFIKKIKKLKNIKVVGLASHLSEVDNGEMTNMQIINYREALAILEKNKVFPKWRHLSASGGAYVINDGVFNLIRAGLASYGISPFEKRNKSFNKLKFTPALTFVSTLVQIKIVNKGETIGYDCTYKVLRKMRIGIVAAGYYDGVDRRLSNIGTVMIRGKKCRILGRVSMNITVVDLTNLKEVRVGDEVIIISSLPNDDNSLVKQARKCNTIPYELLVHLAESLRRELVE